MMVFSSSLMSLSVCITGRVFDPNKHCGVQDPETKRPCTRSLTCKVTQTLLANVNTPITLQADYKGIKRVSD